MDDKIIKSVIFDNQTVLSKTAEQPIDVDFTLPEYYPDISKILKCHCQGFISSKGTNGNTLSAEGVAVITVIYVDNDNMLNSYEYRYIFSKGFDLDGAEGNLCTCVNVKTDYINCRAVTARKIDVHGALSIIATAVKKTENEIVTDTMHGCVEVLRQTVSAATPLSCNEKSVAVEEEIEIGAAKKDINCIIRYSGEVSIKESKLIAGKVMVKGELSISLLYCNDDGEIDSIKETIPFGQMIEAETATENCGTDTTAALSSFEIKPKSDSEGKLRSFSVNAKILLTADTYCTEDTTVLLDAYSRKHEITTSKTEMVFTKIAENISESFSAKQSVTLPGIYKIIDLWCSVKQVSSSFNEGVLSGEGTLAVNVLYFDEDQTPLYAEREIPFTFERQTTLFSDEYFADPKITVSSCSYLISSGEEVEIRAELSLFATVYECKRFNVLTDLTVNTENAARRKSECAMAVYFAEKGERLWDIAANYLADLEEIKKINDIEDTVLKTDKALLIPLL